MNKKLNCKRLLALLLTMALLVSEGSITYAAQANDNPGEYSTSVLSEEDDSLKQTDQDESEADAETEPTAEPEQNVEQQEENTEGNEDSEDAGQPEETEQSEETEDSEDVEQPEEMENSEQSEEAEEPEDTEQLEELESSEAVDEPSVSPMPSASPTVLPDDALFSGLAEGYSLSEKEMADKREAGLHIREIGNLSEGVNYVDNEIIVEAETEELAQAYAEAFDGKLEEYSYGVALISLNADNTKEQVTVAEAVAASANMKLRLPAAWPNYYGYKDTEETDEIYDCEEILQDEESFDAAELVEEKQRTASLYEEAGNGIATNYRDEFLQADSPYYQWHHAAIGSAAAWNSGYKGSGVKVAVLDTGLDGSHFDVSGTRVEVNSLGFDDSDGHGTHVAGLIAAHGSTTGSSGTGGIGVAPEATLYAINVFGTKSSYEDYNVITAIGKAIELEADIINMSLGGPSYNQVFQDKITEAYEAGIAVFCAAGNDHTNSMHYPAGYDHAITIAALDKDYYRAYFSNYGSYVNYSAPGVGIWSTYPGNKYYSMDGTSQATPITSGIAAVILSSGIITESKEAKVNHLLQVMNNGCVKVNGSGTGKGMVSLPKALGLSSAASKPKAPKFSEAAGTRNATSLSVTITAEPGMIVLYSIDGKDVSVKNGLPSSNALYEMERATVTITGARTTTLKAITFNPNNGLSSNIVSATYVLKPVAGEVNITSATNIYTIAKGKKLQLNATVLPSYAKDKTVKWEVDGRPSGVTVSSKGIVSVASSANAGEYTIIATAKNINGNYAEDSAKGVRKIEVVEAAALVKAITAKATKITVGKGKTKDVNITVTKTGNTKGTPSELVWTTSNPSVADVSAGESAITITGKGAGKATITGAAQDGSGKKVTITVTGTQPVTAITISGYQKLAAGKSVTLKASISPTNASVKKVKWSMAEGSTGVSVNAKTGKVTASSRAASGNYTVIAKATDGSDVTGTYEIEVLAEKMTSLKINGKSQTSAVLFRRSNRYDSPTSIDLPIAANTNNWVASSSKPGIAQVTVTTDGIRIEATSATTGTAVITVKSTDGTNLKATCTVTVKNPPTNLYISPEKNRADRLAKGKTLKLTPVFETACGPIAKSSKKLTWKSSDTSLAVVDASGKVTAKKNSGAVIITATTKDGSNISATCKLTLYDKITEICGAYENNDGYYVPYPNSFRFKMPTPGYGYLMDIIPFSGEYFATNPSCRYEATVNKKGLAVQFVYNNEILLVPKKAGTYKVTLSCLDGSAAKKTYTVTFYN